MQTSRWTRSVVSLVLFLAACSSVSAQPAPPAYSFDRAAASQLVRDYLARNGVPGAVVVVTHGSRLVFEEGFGVDGQKQAMTPVTRVPLCSVSKSFVSLGILQLVESGALALDAPVVQMLPEFALADTRVNEITVRHLLSHRSGMSDRTFREKSLTPTPASLTEAVAALRSAPLASAPGTRRSYHNPNYWVLARLIETASHQPFDTFMREHIFTPLGMTSSSVWNRTNDAPDVAAGHIRILNRPIAVQEPAWFLGGSCGVVTTARDLGPWLVMHITGVSMTTGQRLVSAAALDTMHDGLGWNSTGTPGHRKFSHNGMMFTYSSNQVLLPDLGEGVGIAVVANAGVGLSPLPADEIAALLVVLVEGGQPVQPVRVGLIADMTLFGLAITCVGISLLRMRRNVSTMTRSRSAWRSRRTFVLASLSLCLLLFYPAVLRTLLGRDLNWPQSLYATPGLFVLVVVLAVVSLGSVLRSFGRRRA